VGTPTSGSPPDRRESADAQRGANIGVPSRSLFDIQDDRRNEVVRLALRGELDLATAPTLEQHLTRVEQDDVGGCSSIFET
jgi:hypothetical protein